MKNFLLITVLLFSSNLFANSGVESCSNDSYTQEMRALEIFMPMNMKLLF